VPITVVPVTDNNSNDTWKPEQISQQRIISLYKHQIENVGELCVWDSIDEHISDAAVKQWHNHLCATIARADGRHLVHNRS